MFYIILLNLLKQMESGNPLVLEVSQLIELPNFPNIS